MVDGVLVNMTQEEVSLREVEEAAANAKSLKQKYNLPILRIEGTKKEKLQQLDKIVSREKEQRAFDLSVLLDAVERDVVNEKDNLRLQLKK